jgi:hypothetical protein
MAFRVTMKMATKYVSLLPTLSNKHQNNCSSPYSFTLHYFQIKSLNSVITVTEYCDYEAAYHHHHCMSLIIYFAGPTAIAYSEISFDNQPQRDECSHSIISETVSYPLFRAHVILTCLHITLNTKCHTPHEPNYGESE